MSGVLLRRTAEQHLIEAGTTTVKSTQSLNKETDGASIRTESGVQDGKQVLSGWKERLGKNPVCINKRTGFFDWAQIKGYSYNGK
jgi:hypothetical protein